MPWLQVAAVKWVPIKTAWDMRGEPCLTLENFTAADSVIRDVDMAAEMTSFTKNQILLQAGTAMLAQANQAPQMVLSLFK